MRYPFIANLSNTGELKKALCVSSRCHYVFWDDRLRCEFVVRPGALVICCDVVWYGVRVWPGCVMC